MATLELSNLTQEQKKLAIEDFINTIYKSGTYVNIKFKKTFDILKNWLKANADIEKPLVEKYSTMTCRLDINYQNTSDYDNHQHTKKYTNNQVLDNLFEYNTETQKYKMRIFKTSMKEKINSQYQLNGETITKKDLELLNMITTSEFKPHTFDSIVFTPLLENILEISYK